MSKKAAKKTRKNRVESVEIPRTPAQPIGRASDEPGQIARRMRVLEALHKEWMAADKELADEKDRRKTLKAARAIEFVELMSVIHEEGLGARERDAQVRKLRTALRKADQAVKDAHLRVRHYKDECDRIERRIFEEIDEPTPRLPGM